MFVFALPVAKMQETAFLQVGVDRFYGARHYGFKSSTLKARGARALVILRRI